MTHVATHKISDRKLLREFASQPFIEKYGRVVREQLSTPKRKAVAAALGLTLLAGAAGALWSSGASHEKQSANSPTAASSGATIQGQASEQHTSTYSPALVCTDRTISYQGEVINPSVDSSLVDGQTYSILPVVTPEASDFNSRKLATVAFLSKYDVQGDIIYSNFQFSNNINDPVDLTYVAGNDVRVVVVDLTGTGLNQLDAQTAEAAFIATDTTKIPEWQEYDCNSNEYAQYGIGSTPNQ